MSEELMKVLQSRGTIPLSALVSQAPRWWSLDTMPGQVTRVALHVSEVLDPRKKIADIPHGFLLHGLPGIGKTSAALYVGYLWGIYGRRVLYQDFEELVIRMRSSWRKDAVKTTEQIYDEMWRPQLLILDDIGRRATPEDQETCSVLVKGRIDRGLVTISTTNHDIGTEKGRADFDAACDSRVRERYTSLDISKRFGTENLRIKMNKKDPQ